MDLEDLQRLYISVSSIWGFLAAPLLLWYQHRRNRLVSLQLREVQLNLAELERKQSSIARPSEEEFQRLRLEHERFRAEIQRKTKFQRVWPFFVGIMVLVPCLYSLVLDERLATFRYAAGDRESESSERIEEQERSIESLLWMLSERTVVRLDMAVGVEKLVPAKEAHVWVPDDWSSFSLVLPVGGTVWIQEFFHGEGGAMGWGMVLELRRESEGEVPVWRPRWEGLYRLRLKEATETSTIAIVRQ